MVLTPHPESATLVARRGMAVLAAKNLPAMLQGGVPPTGLHPEVLADAASV